MKLLKCDKCGIINTTNYFKTIQKISGMNINENELHLCKRCKEDFVNTINVWLHSSIKSRICNIEK